MKLRNKIACVPKGKPIKNRSIYPTNLSGLLAAVVLLMLPFLLGSCEAIGGIFKAGMGFGIFLVVGVAIAIIFFVMRMGKNKNS